MIPRPGIQKHYPPSNASMVQLHGTSGPSSLHSISSHQGSMMHGAAAAAAAWQASLSDVHSAVHHHHQPQHHVMASGGGGAAGMVIPRAKVKRSQGYTNEGYHTDDDGMSDEVFINQDYS